ncbi:MAG: UDP-N-acetylglucosamine 1-carboxyvinyltransferase [Oscillospiraceae bacterium]|nr:UDP-N-acetylglucosamine 1-carboxyvinyltransferase [Oscillospiraceae bacterium]
MESMKCFEIQGQKPLIGEIAVNGSKNSVLSLIPALCIGEGTGILKNSPIISDISSMKAILNELNIDITTNRDELVISNDICYSKLSPAFVSRIRASNLFLGVLLSKYGKAEVPVPGGDRIGNRPLDIHFYIFSKFGIDTRVEDGYIKCNATEFPFEGQTVFLRYPSVGATENAMLIASLAKSSSIIYNAAMEPEITDMAILLNKMGASISGAGTPVIRIIPAKELKRVEHDIMPDRLEAGTMMFYAAATKGRVIIKNVVPSHLISVISLLSDCGVNVTVGTDSIEINAMQSNEYSNIYVSALPYPGFPTDLQPFASVFAFLCQGESVIEDNVYKERFAYLQEVMKMGLSFNQSYGTVLIKGPQKFTGAEMEGFDIRMTAAVIMAALMGEGVSRIHGLSHLYRGYDNFYDKLKAVKADIKLCNL